MVTKRLALGCTFLAIGCCGNGPWWACALIGGYGVWLLWTGEGKGGAA